MATIKAFTSAGEAGADIAFDDAQLTLEKGAQAVKDAVTAIRNAMRAGTACTKGKGEVAGSNKKPWINYSVTNSLLDLNKDKTELCLSLTVDTQYSSIMDYFEIFLERMNLCRRAAEKLGLRFRLVINEQFIL